MTKKAVKQTVLVIDDNPQNLDILGHILNPFYKVKIATNGKNGLKIATSQKPPDIILLDVVMPGMDGYEVCKRLKENPKTQRIPVIFVTAKDEIEDEKLGLKIGGVDYVTKPFNPSIILARVKNHLELKLYQDQLKELVEERTKQIREGYIDTIQRLTLTAEYKDEETGLHIKRISFYTKELSSALGEDGDFVESIFYASPMHDIGKVAIPDSILLKPGPLDDDEWEIMKTHTSIGAKILRGSVSPYLKTAVDIAQSHHERWDGGGYPQRLKNGKIPLTARIMNICDQYDALRSKRPYKPPFTHKKTAEIITKGDGRTMPDHFDPEIIIAFKKSLDKFEEIYETYKDQ